MVVDAVTGLVAEPARSDQLPQQRAGEELLIAELAVEHHHDVVIVDTAGRDRLDDELQAELERIHKVANATERFLVIDAQVGQAAGPVAAGFHELVGVSGVIVSKLDGTARGGGALSAVATTGAPIVFIGEGEKVSDLEKFAKSAAYQKFYKKLQIRDQSERMRIIKLMSQQKDEGEKVKPKPTIEKLYHCNTRYDE